MTAIRRVPGAFMLAVIAAVPSHAFERFIAAKDGRPGDAERRRQAVSGRGSEPRPALRHGGACAAGRG